MFFNRKKIIERGFELWLFFNDENGNRVYADQYLEESFILENYPVLPRVKDTMAIDIGYAGLEGFKISEEIRFEEATWDWFGGFFEKFDSYLFKVSDVQLDYHNPGRSAIIFLDGKLKHK